MGIEKIARMWMTSTDHSSKIIPVMFAPLTRPGKRLHNYRTSPCFMGKFTINGDCPYSYVKLPEGSCLSY